MASTASSICKLSLTAFLPSQLGTRRLCFFKPHPCSGPTPTTFKRHSLASKVRASSSSTAFVETTPTDNVVVEDRRRRRSNILACPICYKPLNLIGDDSVLSVDCLGSASLECSTCKKRYIGNESHLELTVISGSAEYNDAMPPSTQFFRIPFVSFLYERGWRQNFFLGGFPGVEREFELMKEYIKPVLGGNIVDASCGSGLFARLFAKSGLFSFVVALDYSESMLQQCYEFVKQEENFPKENLILVRADISRLPFVSGSVDAVHAGAAIHCWPSPSAAVAEISRVLKPGGVFVGTTYILDGPFSFIPVLRPLSQNIKQVSGSNIFLDERELEDICSACGLAGFTCTRNRQFVMFAATKPY